MNSFKALSRIYSDTVERLQAGENNDAIGEEKRFLLEEIVEFLHGYSWLCKSLCKEKVKTFIESGFDYQEVQDKFGVSYAAAKQTVSWASKKFKRCIGERTLKLIEEGNVQEARASFYVHSGKLNLRQLFPVEVVKMFPKEQFDVESLKNCETELKVLKMVSCERIHQLLAMVDERKLAYILWLLMGTSKKADAFRPYLLSVIYGQMGIDEFIGLEEEIKNQMRFI